VTESEPALFGVPELLEGAHRAGPTEAGLRAALEAVTRPDRDGALPAEAAALVGSALVGARALDAAMRKVATDAKAGYLVAALLTPYRETCQAIGLPVPTEPAPAPAPDSQGVPADWERVFGRPE
jgi:hypothetical protein